MTVKEVSRLTGISIRALHYYDQIGLLHPAKVTEAGYRIYGEKELARLQQIMLFRELQIPLKEIAGIIDRPDFDRDLALRQQIKLLTLKKEHLETLIAFAEKLRKRGEMEMDFQAFDTEKIDRYTKEAREKWGKTEAYREFEEKSKNRGKAESEDINKGLMALFAEFGTMMSVPPEDEAVQRQVKKLQAYITAHFYRCSNEILAGLGQMYGAGGEFTQNIDHVGGAGCAAFCEKAIAIYCGK